MKAAFNIQPGKFEIRDVPVPDLAPGEALVRVHACGICGSDKNEFRSERPPRIAGHEFAGVIEKIADPSGGFSPGDRVTAAPLTESGVIGYSRPGAFAEYCAVPVSALLPLPGYISFAEASFTEPAAVGLHAATRTHVGDKTCLVFGAGTIGIVTALSCEAMGAKKVWIVDLEPRHLKAAADCGLLTLNSRDDPDLTRVSGAAIDITFECVGHSKALMDAALQKVKAGGAVVLIGAGHESIPFEPVLGKALTVYGSQGTTHEELLQALHWIGTGAMPVEPIISAVFPLAQMNEAFAASLTAQKIIVEP